MTDNWEQVTDNISLNHDQLTDDEFNVLTRYINTYEQLKLARNTVDWFMEGQHPDYWYDRQDRLREATNFISRFLGPRDGVPREEWWDETDSGGACVTCLAPVKREYADKWAGHCGDHWPGMNFRLFCE